MKRRPLLKDQALPADGNLFNHFVMVPPVLHQLGMAIVPVVTMAAAAIIIAEIVVVVITMSTMMPVALVAVVAVVALNNKLRGLYWRYDGGRCGECKQRCENKGFHDFSMD